MSDYVQATLQKRTAGAQDAGNIYDYDLELTTPSGQTLNVFDPETLSEGLKPGENRAFLLVVDLVEDLAAGEDPSPDGWNGEVMSLDWQPNPGDFSQKHPDLAGEVFIRLKTAVGDVYMFEDVFWDTVSVGDTVHWRGGRWDLYGIV